MRVTGDLKQSDKVWLICSFFRCHHLNTEQYLSVAWLKISYCSRDVSIGIKISFVYRNMTITFSIFRSLISHSISSQRTGSILSIPNGMKTYSFRSIDSLHHVQIPLYKQSHCQYIKSIRWNSRNNTDKNGHEFHGRFCSLAQISNNSSKFHQRICQQSVYWQISRKSLVFKNPISGFLIKSCIQEEHKYQQHRWEEICCLSFSCEKDQETSYKQFTMSLVEFLKYFLDEKSSVKSHSLDKSVRNLDEETSPIIEYVA